MADIVEQLDGPHEWGYRGLAGEGFIHDPAPNNAARVILKLRAALHGCVEHMEWSTPQGEAAYKAARKVIAGDPCAAADHE